MGDVITFRGKTADMSNVTRREWKDFVNPRGKPEQEDKIVAKCFGLTLEEVDALTVEEFRQAIKSIVMTHRELLTNPN